jgi:hypothetical protein
MCGKALQYIGIDILFFCRAARRAGLGVSAYVLALLLPPAAFRFQELTEACADSRDPRFAPA